MANTEKHISRRDVLKKSAAAGAVFWAVPVIESVTSRAAAQSGCINIGTASYVWVIFTVNGNTYATGTNGGSSCNNQNTLKGGPVYAPGTTSTGCASAGTCGDGRVYFSPGFNGGAINFTYAATCALAPTGTAVRDGTTICPTYIQVSNGTISAMNGAVIVAYFKFTGSNATGACNPTNSALCVNFAFA